MNTGTPKNNNLGVFYTNIGKNVNKGLNMVNEGISDVINNASETITNIKNTVVNTPKNISSLLPFKTNIKSNVNTPVNGNNSIKNVLQNITNTKNANTGAVSYGWLMPVILFIAIAAICIVIFVKFEDKINAGINNIIQKVRDAFNGSSSPLEDGSKEVVNVTEEPVPPQEEQTIENAEKNQDRVTNIIDKVIPQSNPEVFNVSENDYTFYDAEPLCRALGAELATYDQVKDAWSKGADWCNYGWVKGQAAVYPTQKETWQKVQSGPDENKNSCGVVGVNGGYFENPEMKFGVTCYGPKPLQSQHSQELLMREGNVPLSVPALEVDRKTQEFRSQSDSIGVLPFNENKWAVN
jgi:hypothetical protein